jgi:hypothetical protein
MDKGKGGLGVQWLGVGEDTGPRCMRASANDQGAVYALAG